MKDPCLQMLLIEDISLSRTKTNMLMLTQDLDSATDKNDSQSQSSTDENMEESWDHCIFAVTYPGRVHADGAPAGSACRVPRHQQL